MRWLPLVQGHAEVTYDSTLGAGRALGGGLLLLSVAVACAADTVGSAGGKGGDTSEAGQAAESGRPGSGGEGGQAALANLGGAAGADLGGVLDTQGGQGEAGGGVAGAPSDASQAPVYAASVESFSPGSGAGFNEANLPGIALGPPKGRGTSQGSLDVVSLGVGGEIVLAFGEQRIIDGPGPDFIVFENPFWPGGDASQVFAELGEVSVSEDGKTWHTFTCDVTGDGKGHFPGCAGVTPTLVYDAARLVPLEPDLSGGDAFDLAELQLTSARYVKLRDLATLPSGGNTSGFDLDAVGAIHAR